MNLLRNLPVGGFVVIVVIGLLFVLSLLILFYTSARYRALAASSDGDGEGKRGFLKALLAEFSASYQKYGRDVNTPAIISDVIGKKLGGLLLCERFLNNAVSLFVTLGLFGTFLGLSMSVSSLTKLISYSNTEEWLSVLDSVGGGLMSALGGMGVAFYTSLVGAGCSILLTILRTIFNPQTERERLETRLELWLDTEVAPTLATEAARDDADLINNMIHALNSSVTEIRQALGTAALAYAESTKNASAALVKAAGSNKTALEVFDQTVDKFNNGVHDFSEVDYNLRGSVERMDLAVRDLASAMREINRRMGASREGAAQ
ncbi:MAG: hypothetical protein ACSW8E_01090 [Clostridia bacterium]